MRNIVVLCGSDSDFRKIASGLAVLREAEAQDLICVLAVEVCSAHRNPDELRELLRKFNDCSVDAVIVCAGKLAAIFGYVDSISRNGLGNKHTLFIAVPLKGETENATQAAYLAATEVPDSQFVFMEEFFHDPAQAFWYAICGVRGEFPTVQLREQKPSRTLTLQNAYHEGRQRYTGEASADSNIALLESGGLIHWNTGKTREIFVNPECLEYLYILATDRVSIFDRVLNAAIPMKGAVLTAATVHWLLQTDIPNHLKAFGRTITDYFPERLRYVLSSEQMRFLMRHMIVVKRVRVFQIEAIVRGFLTGSSLTGYQQTGKVCGIELPRGLSDGSELPQPIFTPSTKAPYGEHDENIDFEDMVERIGLEAAETIRDLSLRLYEFARDMLRPLGIILADTKFEFAYDEDGRIVLCDEALTPDSSRFWLADQRQAALDRGEAPPSLDKQIIRDAGKAAGFPKTNPCWVPPRDLVEEMTSKYLRMFEIMAGMPIERFWRESMKID
ncbi:MAG: phosphoribosylaminoimidazolesuccinocarboxamide synthase [Candidatus Moraniibacteriota bacterium]|nr:MAG: phosphoribosylaminoimidazolesuccinocarboxamide synthase [Candidatus Moranbacteria bacterium]